MCLLLLALQAHPVYPLVMAANRDEFYERPTAAAHFWEDRPDILGGRDLRSGGTWLGISQKGRIGAVTNYRDPASLKTDAPSRGNLVSDYLTGGEDPQTYLDRLGQKAATYNGFNLVVGIQEDLFWYSNRRGLIYPIPPGIHGLSNHLLNTPWPKVTRGKEALREVLDSSSFPSTERLFEMLIDRSVPPDDALPDTGVGIEWERLLSPIFIASPGYGTRSSTILLIDREDRVTLIERTYDPGSESCKDAAFEFKIDG